MKPRIIDRIILITRDGLRQEYSATNIMRGARDIRIACSDASNYGFGVYTYRGSTPPTFSEMYNSMYRTYHLMNTTVIDIGDTQEVFAFYKEQA